MAEICLYSLYIVADHQGIDSETMTQIVETDIFDACPIADGFEMFHNRSPDQMLSKSIGEYIIVGIVPTFSIGKPVSGLLLFFIL